MSWFLRPFGDKVWLYPINFAMQPVEFAAKTIRMACGCSAICTPAN